MKNVISDRLNYLMVLAEEQNITRAAARLFVSQPALTAYINRLEEEVGTKLFDRSATPIKITPAGAYYISEMEKIHAKQAALYDELKHLDVSSDLRLSVAIGRNRGSVWLPQILPAVYEKCPDAQLTVTEDRDISMSEKVVRGILDVAIVESYAYHSMLTYLILPDEYHVMITGENNPLLAGYDLTGNSIDHPLNIDAEILASQMFICPSISGSLNRYTSWMFSTYNFHPQKMLHVSNDITAYRLALQGTGLVFQNAAYSAFIRSDVKPVFIMPGGKPTARRLFAIFNNKHESELKNLFLTATHNIMSEIMLGRQTKPEYMV